MSDAIPSPATEVPDWVDLERIVPTELRERLDAATTEASQLLEQLHRASQRATALVIDAESRWPSSLPDDVADAVGEAVGTRQLLQLYGAMAATAEKAAGGTMFGGPLRELLASMGLTGEGT